MEIEVPLEAQSRTRDQISWLLLSVAWLGLSALKFVPLLVSKVRLPVLAIASGAIEMLLAALILVPTTRGAALKASVAIAALLLLANLLPIDALRVATSSCKCLGPWVNADETTKRATASVLLVASVYSIRRGVEAPSA
jgi:hypothetical protein